MHTVNIAYFFHEITCHTTSQGGVIRVTNPDGVVQTFLFDQMFEEDLKSFLVGNFSFKKDDLIELKFEMSEDEKWQCSAEAASFARAMLRITY
jgi:hypothetical protein